MSPTTKDFIARLAAVVVAFVFCFMTVCIVGGFTAARLMGLPVDVDKFYGIVSPAYMIMLNGVMVLVAVDRARKP